MGMSPPNSAVLLCAMQKSHVPLQQHRAAPGDEGLEAAFSAAQTLWVMFVLLWGQRIPAGRAGKEVLMRNFPIGICRRV